MASVAKVVGSAGRESPYVGELREFFASHGLQSGSPNDVMPFVRRLSLPGTFRNEMRSMIRSILFREGSAVPREGMLGLVAVAVGGSRVQDLSRDQMEAIRNVLAFLSEVLTSPWGMPESTPEEEAAADGSAAALEEAGAPVEVMRSERRSAERLGAGAGLESAFVEPEARVAVAAEAQVAVVVPEARLEPFVAPVLRDREERMLFEDKTHRSHSRWVWMACVVAIVLAVGTWFLVHRDQMSRAGKDSDPVITPYYPNAANAAAAPKTDASRTTIVPARSGRPRPRAKMEAESSPAGAEAAPADDGEESKGAAAQKQAPAPIYRVSPESGDEGADKPATADQAAPH